MNETEIEAMIASPAERDELVVQLFVKDGGQWGEIYREGHAYWIELYISGSTTLRFNVDTLTQTMDRAKTELRDRLE